MSYHRPDIEDDSYHGPERRRRQTNALSEPSRKIFDALIASGIIALVGVVWNLSNSMAGLTVQIKYLTDQVAELRQHH